MYNNVQYTLYTVQCTVYTALYNVHYTMYAVPGTWYNKRRGYISQANYRTVKEYACYATVQ